MEQFKHTITYKGIIDTKSALHGYLFNFGTESELGARTSEHRNKCAANKLVYEVTYEKADRLIPTKTGMKVIKRSEDSHYIKELVKNVNKLYPGMNTADKAMTFSDWVEHRLDAKEPIANGYYSAIKLAELSLTEMAYIPERISRAQLSEAEKITDSWYFEKAKRDDAALTKHWANKTDAEKKAAVKPIATELFGKLLNVIHNNIIAKNKQPVFARVQSIELAYLLSTIPALHCIKKFRVIITADDKVVNQKLYNIISNNERFELVEYDTDLDVAEELMNKMINPDLDIMNPPYAKTLHLQVLDKVIEIKKPDSVVISVQPVGWLENPVLAQKSRSPFNKFLDSVLPNVSSIKCMDANTACKLFNIEGGVDLAIYTIGGEVGTTQVIDPIVSQCINKICFTSLESLAKKCTTNSIDGWRCEVKDLTFGSGGHNQGDAESSKQCAVKLVLGPYYNGYDKDGKFFTQTRQKNQNTKDWFKSSIKFATELEAVNFYQSCNTNFYKRLIQLLNVNSDPQHEFLPYMDDYTHAWTDEDYCKFFGLTPEESNFMCKAIDDYRIKDYVKYTNVYNDFED